jgi:Rod binding domain-containing protein
MSEHALTDRLLRHLAKHLREEPGEANGNMPAAMQEEVARTHAEWASTRDAIRLLVGRRLVDHALDALEDE